MRKSARLSAFSAAALVLALAPAALARCPESPPLVADWQVDFAPSSAALPSSALEQIRELAARAQTRRVGHVCLYGAAERREEGNFGDSLALDRAEAVAAELRAAGLPALAIEVVPPAKGDGFLGALGGGEGRRVDIVFE